MISRSKRYQITRTSDFHSDFQTEATDNSNAQNPFRRSKISTMVVPLPIPNRIPPRPLFVPNKTKRKYHIPPEVYERAVSIHVHTHLSELARHTDTQGQKTYEAGMIVRSSKRQEIEEKKTAYYDAESRAEKAEEEEVAEAITKSLHQFKIDERRREGGGEEGSSSSKS